MSTQLSTKLAALAVALMVNALMIGGTGYLFSAQLHQKMAAKALVRTAPAQASGPTI